MKRNLRLLTLFIILSSKLMAQPGKLDNRFGDGGFVLTNVGGQNNSFGYDVLMQPDRKTVVSGKAQISSSLVKAVLIRYKINGDLDSSFGTNGIVLESFGNSFDVFSSVALQEDGKFVVSGLGMRNDSSFVLFARYNSNGTLDTCFRNKQSALKYYGFGNVGCGVIVQPDQKILLLLNNNEDITYKAQTQIERYNQNGTIDKSFAIKGNLTYTGDFWFTKFTQDRKGLIVCLSGDAGFTSLIRIKNNGVPDKTFGVNGLLTTRLSPYDGSDNLITQPDGKIIVCGFLQASNFVDVLFSVSRFNTNGSLDSSFNGTGINSTRINGFDYAYDVDIQSNGKLIATGFTFARKATYIALMRYNLSNGHTDSTWGKNGIDTVVTTWQNIKYSYAVASAISADGARIAVTGNQTARNSSQNEFLTARFILHNPQAVEISSSSSAVTLQKENALVYPNPAINSSKISFTLQQTSEVHIKLINTKGEIVSMIYNGSLSNGSYAFPIELTKVSSGIYYVVLQTGNKSTNVKLIKL